MNYSSVFTNYISGGLELDVISNAIICERFAYGCTGITTAMTTNILAETPLILAASDEIKKNYLGRMVEEPLMAVSIKSNNGDDCSNNNDGDSSNNDSINNNNNSNRNNDNENNNNNK